MMKININDKVTVYLTETGKNAVALSDIGPFEIDENGCAEFHLWELMRVFGPYMFNGNPNLPFEPTIFYRPFS